MRRPFAQSTSTRFASASLASSPWGLVLTAAGDAAPGLETIRADALKGHIFFLASDAMAGRDSLSHEASRMAGTVIAARGEAPPPFSRFSRRRASRVSSARHFRRVGAGERASRVGGAWRTWARVHVALASRGAIVLRERRAIGYY
jgi:hypothetical protein